MAERLIFRFEDGGSIPTPPLQQKRIISLIDKHEAKRLIIKNHYTHKFSSCRYAFGILNSDYSGCITGVAVFGFPVGRQVHSSISPLISKDDILELTRLWCDDIEPRNTESWFISKCISWLKKNTNIKVLISYADPEANHLGTIYQASNWLYQGNKTMMIRGYKHFVLGEWLHPRTCVARYGTIKAETLLKIDPNYQRVFQLHKHRYIYILKNKDEILGGLKHPILQYPKEGS